MLKFQKATKSSSKLRLALFGPSGSGKTYTALSIATGLGGSIAVIDTERGSASKYADRFQFDVLELPATDIDTYLEGIKAASGYSILIIDSLSHAWQALLEEVDRIAKGRYRGNTWSAWSDGTPKQRSLVNAILGFNGHLIATMRSKTEWTLTKDEKGGNRPERIGLAPEQGKGIEYEFDLVMEMTADHIGHITKDRTGRYQDVVITKPSAEFGQELLDWLMQDAVVGERPAPADSNTVASGENAPEPAGAPTKAPAGWSTWDERAHRAFWAQCGKLNISEDTIHAEFGVSSMKEWAHDRDSTRLILDTLDYGINRVAIGLGGIKTALGVSKMVDMLGRYESLEEARGTIESWISEQASEPERQGELM